MSRAYINFHMGDYDRDTQALSTLEHGAYFLLLKHCWVHGSIPTEPTRRAQITKLTLQQWNRIASAVDPFFDGDGRNKRATIEIEKVDLARLKRAVAGHRGGIAAGRTRIKQRPSNATGLATSNDTGDASGLAQAKLKHLREESKLTSTSLDAARASENPTKSIPVTDDLQTVLQKKGWVR